MDAFVSLSGLQLKLQPYVVTRHAAARHQLCNTPSLAKFGSTLGQETRTYPMCELQRSSYTWLSRNLVDDSELLVNDFLCGRPCDSA